MKATNILFVFFLEFLLLSCEKNISETDIRENEPTSFAKNSVSSNSVLATSHPNIGMLNVYVLADNLDKLKNAGVKYISLAPQYPESLDGLKALDTIARQKFDRVLIPITGAVLKSYSLKAIKTFMDSFSPAGDTYFYIDEPYHNYKTYPLLLQKVIEIMSYKYKQVYISEPHFDTWDTDFSILMELAYKVMPSNYTVSLETKYVNYKLLLNNDIEISPLIGLTLNAFQNNASIPTEINLRRELYVTAPFTSEVWFYTCNSGDTNDSIDPDTTFNLFTSESGGVWTILEVLLNSYANDMFGTWHYSLTEYGNHQAQPTPADYDGDGKVDLSVKTDDGGWFIDYAKDGFDTWEVQLYGYGGPEAIPCPGKYKDPSPDNKADISVKTNGGLWLIDYSYNGFGSWDYIGYNYGSSNAIPCPADFDGDNYYDLAVKENNVYYFRLRIDKSNNGYSSYENNYTYYGYGNSTAHPVPAKYKDPNSDNKADISLKTDDGKWLIDYSHNGFVGWEFTGIDYGGVNAIPCPADYDADNFADPSVKNSSGEWSIDLSSVNGYGFYNINKPGYGGASATPCPADYDGDGRADLSVRDNTSRMWYFDFYQIYFDWYHSNPE